MLATTLPAQAAAPAATKAPADPPKFTFTALPPEELKGFNDSATQELLEKWGLRENTYMHRFAFNQEFSEHSADLLVADLLNSAAAQGLIRVKGQGDLWGSLGRVSNVRLLPLAHDDAATSLALFDTLAERGITRPDGDICKCLDEYSDDGFVVSDLLRRALLMPESDEYAAFPDAARRQMLFCILRALALGGKLCQYEDRIEPYFTTSKALYRDLASVRRDAATGAARVSTFHYQLVGAESSVSPLFPLENVQNFCLVAIEPQQRHVTVWYHASPVFYQ